MTERKKIFMLAGEESGDNLGSRLMRAMKERYTGELEFVGVGGTKMAYEGLHTIFPMQQINMMGFAEIVPHLPELIKKINSTVERILREKPDVVVTIDSPGFNFRVAKKLRQQGFKAKMVHYVAPSVWAYKPQRAKKIAKLFDHLIAILPWEPPYFEKEGLTTSFIGHPVFEDIELLDAQQKKILREKYNYQPTDKLVAIMPGSRSGEVKKLLPLLVDAANKIYMNDPDTRFILMPTEDKRDMVAKYARLIPHCITVADTGEKRKLLQICAAGMIKSGTVALEVAALGCPHLICYKMSPISYFLIQRMIKIQYANLVNISASKEVIRELLQEKCTAENIAKEITALLSSDVLAKGQLTDAKHELEEMGMGSVIMPSDKAAEVVLKLAGATTERQQEG